MDSNVMLERSDKERLATLEADSSWIKESLERLELGQKEFHRSMEQHLVRHRGNGAANGGNGGVQIIIGKRTLVLLMTVPVGGIVSGALVYLRALGLLG